VSDRVAELAAQWEIPPSGRHALQQLLDVLAADETAPTTVREPDRAVEAHVADALTGLLVPELAAATDIADIGAGAGIPGLVLAAARPGYVVTEVESQQRKCAFMERLIVAMQLFNARVLCARAEEVKETFDAVTARAVAPLPVLVEYAAPLLRHGGVLVAWKGEPEAGEVADGDHAATVLGLAAARAVPVPPLPGADRHSLYVYLKVGSVPNGYPRRAGMARKRPLRASTTA
jgi:16S rRNA (guanine527-N7)-methyltransferase